MAANPSNKPSMRGTTGNQSKVPAMVRKTTSSNSQQSTKKNAQFPKG